MKKFLTEDTSKIRQKHKFSVQIMQELIKATSVDQYLLDGTNPQLTTTLDDRELPTLPMHDTTASDSTANSAPSETKQQDKNESTKTCPKKKKKRGNTIFSYTKILCYGRSKTCMAPTTRSKGPIGPTIICAFGNNFFSLLLC